jgi:hypothetical protein
MSFKRIAAGVASVAVMGAMFTTPAMADTYYNNSYANQNNYNNNRAGYSGSNPCCYNYNQSYQKYDYNKDYNKDRDNKDYKDHQKNNNNYNWWDNNNNNWWNQNNQSYNNDWWKSNNQDYWMGNDNNNWHKYQSGRPGFWYKQANYGNMRPCMYDHNSNMYYYQW